MKVTWRNCFRLGFTALILFLCIHYCDSAVKFVSVLAGAATPFLIGIAIAYLLNILMSFYEKHYFNKFSNKKFVKKSRRTVCMLAAILTLSGIIALIVGLVIPELGSCIKFLLSEIPPAIQKLLKKEWVTEILPKDIIASLTSLDWKSYMSTIGKFLTSGVGSAVSTILAAVSSIFSTIVTAFISIIFSIYLLNDKDKLKKQCIRLMDNYIPAKIVKKIMHCLTALNDSFHRYIVGQCTEAVILGILCMIGMFILRLPYAPMIGTLIGFTALIPVAGAYIGACVGALMILTVSPLKAVIFIVFLIILQQLEGNLIYPRVVGKSIGLPAIWVLAAVTIGGSLMGIMGMLLGVPLAGTLYRLLREDMYSREEKKAKIKQKAAVNPQQTAAKPAEAKKPSNKTKK